MAAVELSFAESFGHELGERDGALTFEEACLQIQGQKLIGPPMKPLKGDRAPGDLRLIDLPLRDMSTTSGTCEQFVDIIQNNLSEGPLKVDQVFLDTKVYPLCAQSKYRDLPEPFCLKTELTVPYSMQFIIHLRGHLQARVFAQEQGVGQRLDGALPRLSCTLRVG